MRRADAEQLARRSVPPTTLSLLGLVRHLAEVEHSWFERVLKHQLDLERLYRTESDHDFDFNGAVADDAVRRGRVRPVARADGVRGRLARRVRRVRPRRGHLDVRDDETASVRDILVHLIEEYARHCGHADLLRECVDGRTGQ